MKKLSFLILFTFPFLLNAQYGLRDCHTDLVFGVDFGGSFNLPNELVDQPFLTDESLFSLRIGTNINYPIANRMQLVTGFRLSALATKTYDAPLIQHEAYTEKRLYDFYVEIPFRARYVFGYSKKQQHLYLEGGIDFGFYIASLAKDEIEQVFGRAESYNTFGISINLAPGFEIESNHNDLKYFIQPILRVQPMAKQANSDIRFYQVGIETGIRF